jgi:hypothetical protein
VVYVLPDVRALDQVFAIGATAQRSPVRHPSL